MEDPAGLVAFLKRVFGAVGELQADAPSQIMIGDSLLMVSKDPWGNVWPVATQIPRSVNKGTIRFPLSEPVPVKLIERIAQFLAKEAAERARARLAGTKKRR